MAKPKRCRSSGKMALRALAIVAVLCGLLLLFIALFGTSQAAPTSADTSVAATTATNVALNRPTTASSIESPALSAAAAVDGSANTRWSSAWSDPQWIYVDLGQLYAISRVLLRWETAYGREYRLEVSNDSSNWTAIYSSDNGTGGTEDIAVKASGRYVRVYGTARATTWGYSLWGFEVYGTSVPWSALIPNAVKSDSTATAIAPTAITAPPTVTPIPSTATAVPPTATPRPPTATAAPPTATPRPPTATAVPPTATPRPPTATAVPPTATPNPPTATAVPPTATTVPPTPTAAPPTSPMPLGVPGAWNMVFRDEFDGASLATSKWVTCYPWFNPQTGCTNTGNSELQWYLPSGVSVGDGTLKLTARSQTLTGTNGKAYSYSSGMVSSGPSQGSPAKFSYQYGFIEARMKLPAGKGFWPAFWTLPNDTSWPPEVDAMEYWGQSPGKIMMNVHWKNAAGVNQQTPSWTYGDFTSAWHTIGLNWTPTSLVWYVDGVAQKTFSDPAGIPAKQMYLILNLAIDGKSPPDGTVAFPVTMEVDYVRAWKQ